MSCFYDFKPKLNQLYLTVGGIGVLFSAFMSFLEKGDGVVYFNPSYPLYLSQIHLTQAKLVFVPLKEDVGWKLDLDRLATSISRKKQKSSSLLTSITKQERSCLKRKLKSYLRLSFSTSASVNRLP